MQCEPYLLFGCDLERRFEGTLFRFPLRTADTARSSEIKNVYYTDEEIDQLLQSFRDTAQVGPRRLACVAAA
jgi:sacsin